MKLVFRFRRPYNLSSNGHSTTRWQLEYIKVENDVATFGIAGGAYRGEDGFWVAHTDRRQKSDCRTRQEAGAWVEDVWRRERGY
jgi:hypothetical protein